MNQSPIRIAVTGPESTGKSSLAQQLAEHFNTAFVEEYAREYINNLDRPYTEDDILAIARRQLLNEEEAAARAGRFLFCDTDLTVCKIWSEVKYKRCHPWIAENTLSHPYPLYLLTDIDLPWEDDPQREHPHMRQYLFDLYKNELDSRGVRYEIVSGAGEERLKCALAYIEKYFSPENIQR